MMSALSRARRRLRNPGLPTSGEALLTTMRVGEIAKMSDQFRSSPVNDSSPIVGRRRVAIAPLPALDRGKQVMNALADYVERAALKSGDRLPTERELMTALSVGRSTI